MPRGNVNYAIGQLLDISSVDMHSGTVLDHSDHSGRTLSGQTGEALYASVRHATLICVGLNFGLGAHIL